MLISDWSSDACSSDLAFEQIVIVREHGAGTLRLLETGDVEIARNIEISALRPRHTGRRFDPSRAPDNDDILSSIEPCDDFFRKPTFGIAIVRVDHRGRACDTVVADLNDCRSENPRVGKEGVST